MAALFAAILPFVLWPIETVLPYPHLVEELAKAVLVFFALQRRPAAAALAGILLAISESTLYLFNIALVGQAGTLLERLLVTIPLHATTFVLMALNLPVGFVLSVLGHYLFNVWVV